MTDDFTYEAPPRLTPYLEVTFVILTLASAAVAVFAQLGAQGDQVTEFIASFTFCATVWLVLRRDVCQWVNSRMQPAVAGVVLGSLAMAALVGATYTIATNRRGTHVEPPIQTVAQPASGKFV